MNALQLKYFSAIYDHRNLSHAASHCNVAQSAISHHLAKLEKEVGVVLFLRKPRGMEPTAAGIKLYEHAKSILRALQVAEQDIRQESDKIEGEIALGLPYSVMKGIGLPLMKAMLARFPDVKLSIVESLSVGTFDDLLASNVDISLFYNPQKDSRVTLQPVLEEDILCIGEAEIIGNSQQPIPFDDVAKHPVLVLRQGVSTRAVYDRPGLFNKLEKTAPFHLNSVNGITMGLLAGFGCTLAPHVLFAEHLKSGRLNARPITNPSLARNLYLGHLRDRPSTRLSETITELLFELVAHEVTSGRWQATLAKR